MQRTRKLLYKDYDERVHHMIDKKLGCLSIHTNIAEFNIKLPNFRIQRKCMFKRKESANINLSYMLCQFTKEYLK